MIHLRQSRRPHSPTPDYHVITPLSWLPLREATLGRGRFHRLVSRNISLSWSAQFDIIDITMQVGLKITLAIICMAFAGLCRAAPMNTKQTHDVAELSTGYSQEATTSHHNALSRQGELALHLICSLFWLSKLHNTWRATESGHFRKAKSRRNEESWVIRY